ncbi:MAG: hypothetical protein P4L71_01445 [Acetobacteraceae bacterium]|nr:hypothetical protein [Acetobacteraceae bacterium]
MDQLGHDATHRRYQGFGQGVGSLVGNASRFVASVCDGSGDDPEGVDFGCRFGRLPGSGCIGQAGSAARIEAFLPDRGKLRLAELGRERLPEGLVIEVTLQEQ